MKTLYLLRHAKSSWSDPSLSDQQRPLNGRGKRNAPLMGERFRERGETLDRIVSSPARRAHTTAQFFAGACGFPEQDIMVDADLYFSGGGSIEGVIRNQTDEVGKLMLVFHNPDITSFSNSLDYDLHIGNVPTAGLVCFECEIERWGDFTRDATRFAYFDYPKNPSSGVVSD